MKKIGIIFFGLIIIIGSGLFFRKEIGDFYIKLKGYGEQVKEELIREEIKVKEEIEKEAILPSPLRAKREKRETFLTKEGVLRWTNAQREKYGLPVLEESEKLNLSAAAKIEEMFKNQYFSHFSPDGKEIADFARQAGYDYILIGENLALGNFGSDEVLVQGWMESSGHRENILNSRYKEIGVAVGKGILEGKETWLAVQHFGLPSSFCPWPSGELRTEIEKKEKEEKELRKIIMELGAEIKSGEIEKEDYWEKIEEYNNYVARYNELVKELESLVDAYNHQVEVFNQCAGGG